MRTGNFRTCLTCLGPGLLLLLAGATAALAGDDTVAGIVTAGAPSSTWIGIEAPLTGDDNANGYSTFEIGPSASGPFTSAGAYWLETGGTSEWRANVFQGLAPGGTYFVRVTYVDPDGVSGANPQVVGPVATLSSAPAAVHAGMATAEARDAEIFVSLPISDDANSNSHGTVEIATGPGGPWTRKCGSPSEVNLPIQPKRCRLRSLTPGTDYWIRFTLYDPDGVSGTNPQVLGPVRYEGLANLALGRPITADPGWGCCPSPSHLVDGRIQNDAWFFGFAWTGGLSHWAGGPDGFKQATIDLGSPTTFSRAAMWYHDPASVPVVWKFQYSHDNATWTDLHVQTQPMCRTAALALPAAWYYPACAHEAAFSPVTARWFRYTFDDRTLFGGIHGWAVELEVFNAPVSGDLVVVNTNDSGAGSLRQAILDANANPATPDTVIFEIPASDPGFDGAAFTIQPLSPLPVLLRATTIDGSTQAAFTGDTNPYGPEIFLDGSLLSAGSGLTLADDNVVTGLVISGFPGHGVDMNWRTDPDFKPSRNRVVGNYIGTDPTGTVAVPNETGDGVFIQGIGSPFAQGTGNVIEGNLISGNLRTGIGLCDADRTEIRGNRIGVDRNGAPLGNGEHGIVLTCAGSPRNVIEGNTIAWNGLDGIHDEPDYRFGVAFTADGHQGNRITGNSIHSNGGLGIDLLPPPFPPADPPATPTPNDSCDEDAGGNLLQNFPELTLAENDGASILVEGFLVAASDRTYTVELFANAAADPSGYGEGETFFASFAVTTDGSCRGDFSVTLPATVGPGSLITATATDAAGNTSEFCPARELVDVGNEPPVADAGADLQAAAGAGCVAEVTLDGTGSSDPDGDPLSYAWSGPFGSASGASPTVALPLGTHTITLIVEDGNGGTDTDEVVVEVLDLAPPVIAAAEAAPGVLWPPDHKMRPVTVSLSAADACDSAPVCHLAGVASNEPENGLGDGDTAPDWQVTGDFTAMLRAERSGAGSGRIYTLAVVCEDAAGNAAQGSAAVEVPHSAPK